ncbi:MAG: hypothetical protein P4N59_29880, partial [Negativicutes bacterium]|nr:hypothetical protein [Negativicutes bacterium]
AYTSKAAFNQPRLSASLAASLASLQLQPASLVSLASQPRLSATLLSHANRRQPQRQPQRQLQLQPPRQPPRKPPRQQARPLSGAHCAGRTIHG